MKSRNYESRNNAISQKYDRMIDDVVMEVSIEKSLYNDKSRYYNYNLVPTEAYRNYEISLYLLN